MRRLVPALLLCLLVGCSASLSLDRPSPTLVADPSVEADGGPRGEFVEADVVDVIDGDTLKVRIDGQVESVRYIGIDAPERGDPGSKRATAENRELVAGGTVVLEVDRSNRDHFGRLLRYVWVREGGEWLFVNRALVRHGLVVAKSYPPDTARQSQLDRAESRARQEKLGIWAEIGRNGMPRE
ncbi:MAG TPA: thermonuclease family protein [Candidatus Limnocylindria bacterium]|jgi:micrococcal nuclease